MIKVICIDDSNRPKEIPVSHWIKKGQEYHVIHISKMANQGFILGCDLSEINLLDLKDCPYECFRLSRFVIFIEDIQKFIELAKDCADLDGVDVGKLLEEQVELVEV